VTATAAARIGPRYALLAAAYAQLRAAGCVPKSGFKFGADFRVYPSAAEDPTATHSAELVQLRPAGGVRKRMVFALITELNAIHWVGIACLMP